MALKEECFPLMSNVSTRSSLFSPAQIRGNKGRSHQVAVFFGDELVGPPGISQVQFREALVKIFSGIKVDVHFLEKSYLAQIMDSLTSDQYALAALIGSVNNFVFANAKRLDFFSTLSRNIPSIDKAADEHRKQRSILLSVVSTRNFEENKRNLRYCDAVICCRPETDNPALELAAAVYRMFASLTVPSMLNIDFADLGRIAKGIGLAFEISSDDNQEIISKLPKSALVAHSALLHFSCSADVRLNEIYAISKAIALRRGGRKETFQSKENYGVQEVRKVNVKMGIRVRPKSENDYEASAKNHLIRNEDSAILGLVRDFHHQKRIEMTAILFGL